MAQKDDKGVKWPGFPERLRQAFQRAGFWKNERPDVMRFVTQHGIQHGIHVSYCYKYINGEAVPDRERLVALALGLGVRPWWLLFGDEATGGGSHTPTEAPQGDRRPLKRKGPTKARGKGDGVGTLRKLAGQTAARYMHLPDLTPACGTRRRVA